jgi:RNA polymerase sigma factor for flagellar operon FliA
MTEAIRGPEAGGDRATADQAIADLWRRFRQDADVDARNGLILHYASLVKFVAGRIGTRLPASVESQDLVSYGTFGLIDAIDKFDAARGFQFDTYAVNRIRGAILDALRKLDWVPRRVRAAANEIQRGLAELEHRLQRSPSDEELAAHLDMTTAELRSALDDVVGGGIVALDDVADPGRGPRLADLLADPTATDPGDAAEDAELRRIVLDAVKALPERERTVVALYYFESMTLGEIGGVLGVTESRVSQIHAKTVLGLRNRLILALR